MQDDYAILSPPHDRALTPVTQPPLKAIHSSSKRLRKWIKPEVKQSRSGRRQGRDTKTDNFNGETRNKGLRRRHARRRAGRSPETKTRSTFSLFSLFSLKRLIGEGGALLEKSQVV
ncbi:hypothetical protein HID58_016660 [Brassica napus]|uniref:Uncharacterized protein n=2 Tax=Brassica napus TaxID=3708 RepID=A0ABQ8DNW2_BRANA|nr:hypothetical protein HID58_016660 [Brassica napus]CDY48002.1 BnaA04g26880D [Brassica napus]